MHGKKRYICRNKEGSMSFFESKISDYITDRKNTVRQLLFTSVFALIFINLYSPFGVDTWYELTRPELFFYSSMVILAGLLIIALSRFLMYFFTRKKRLSNGNYIIWITVEILSLSLVYLLLQALIIAPPEDILLAFRESFKITLLVLLFPYLISYLYLSWVEKNKKLEELTESFADKDSRHTTILIPFHDDKGDLRFSVKKSDLLYLEASDNYVAIHYSDEGVKEKFMIRNSMKNFEDQLEPLNVIRCHRSFIINFDKVKIIRREKDGLVLELDVKGDIIIPISRTYSERILGLFSRYSGKN